MTRRSRSLVGASRRALASCPDLKGESDTPLHRGVGLQVCNFQRQCQGMLCFEVGDGFDSFTCMWPVPRFPYVLPSPARSPTSFAIARSCVWYLMAFA